MGNSMLNAAKKTSLEITPITRVDSRLQLSRVSRIFCQTFSYASPILKDVKEEDVISKALEIAKDGHILNIVQSNKKCPDVDIVTVIEALKWTGYYYATGKRLKFVLASIEPSEWFNKHIGAVEAGKSKMFTSCLLEGYAGDKYTEYSIFDRDVKYLNILGRSVDMYDVSLKEE